ncbi:LD-carboxypeptidase [Alphaproteobacteria bacterium]|nr:LD-carboxypeptidase [Alphaproteobacteria bacterium]
MKEIRVIAPSISWSNSKRRQQNYRRAQARLESLGYKVSFGKYIAEVGIQGTASAKSRAADLNAAFADKNVMAVFALGGGWSANEVLPFVDWQVVRANPKPMIGFSDITVLLNAFYAKTGAVQYLGPNFGTLGKMTEWKYTLANFQAALTGQPTRLVRSKNWGERGQKVYKTKPWKVLQRGKAEATLLGGNLGTFYLLQGTEYCPKFDKPFIFALEDDDEAGDTTAREVSRRFESLLQLPGFRENLCGLIVGRFQIGSKTSIQAVADIINSKNLKTDMPIVLGADFGHTLPTLTLPIGGMVSLNTTKNVKLEINQKGKL